MRGQPIAACPSFVMAAGVATNFIPAAVQASDQTAVAEPAVQKPTIACPGPGDGVEIPMGLRVHAFGREHRR